MYTRELKECPEKFVRNGKCIFGTFCGHPNRLDIRGVANPYSAVTFLPTWVTDLRIKSRLSYFFTVGKYTGYIDFFDAKIFGYAEIGFWDMETKQRFVYRSAMGPRKRFIPHDLNVGFSINAKKSRYLRISWDKKHGKMSVVFNVAKNGVFPAANAALSAPMNSPDVMEITEIMPSPTTRRCSAHYMCALPMRGALAMANKGEVITMDTSSGIAFFDMTRSYMKFHTSGEFVTGIGFLDGKQLVFRLQISEQDAVESDKYNANALFFDGKTTPLPPVRITHNYGLMKKWNIQDTENMVDLSFTPISDNPAYISALIVRTEYHTIYGTFEGTLMTCTGEKISFKSLSGISKKYRIRL